MYQLNDYHRKRMYIICSRCLKMRVPVINPFSNLAAHSDVSRVHRMHSQSHRIIICFDSREQTTIILLYYCERGDIKKAIKKPFVRIRDDGGVSVCLRLCAVRSASSSDDFHSNRTEKPQTLGAYNITIILLSFIL